MRSGFYFSSRYFIIRQLQRFIVAAFLLGEGRRRIKFQSFKYLCFMSTAELEKEVVSRLKPINPTKVILFGSFADGSNDKDSDLDLCIITDSPVSKSEKKRRIRLLLKGLTIAKDILTPTMEEYNFYRNEVGSVYRDIDKKGKILWQSS